MDALVERTARLRLVGKIKNALGEAVEVDEAFEDLAEVWELTKRSSHALQEDPLEKIAKEVERPRKASEKESKAAESLARRFRPRYAMGLDRRLPWEWQKLKQRGRELNDLIKRLRGTTP